jgi:uncharacterized coiled-coil protein SlyX
MPVKIIQNFRVQVTEIKPRVNKSKKQIIYLYKRVLDRTVF